MIEYTLAGPSGPVWAVAYRGDGQQLASASSDGTMRLWDTAAGRCLVTLYQFSGGGWPAVTPEGRYTGDALGKRQVPLAHGWALYPAAMFPQFDDPEAVRAALAPPRTRRRRPRQA